MKLWKLLKVEIFDFVKAIVHVKVVNITRW